MVYYRERRIYSMFEPLSQINQHACMQHALFQHLYIKTKNVAHQQSNHSQCCFMFYSNAAATAFYLLEVVYIFEYTVFPYLERILYLVIKDISYELVMLCWLNKCFKGLSSGIFTFPNRHDYCLQPSRPSANP